MIASVPSAEALIEAVNRDPPDVAIIDIRMPPTHTTEGLVAATQLATSHPEVGALVLSQYVEPLYALRLLTERPHGAGYLLKERVVDIDEFIDALRRLADGGLVLDPDVVSDLLAASSPQQPLDRLTEREREVLALIAQGKSNHAIAERLVLTGKTIDSHIHNIFFKLDLPTTRPPPRARRAHLPASHRHGDPKLQASPASGTRVRFTGVPWRCARSLGL